MKRINSSGWIFTLLLILLGAGCEKGASESPAGIDRGFNNKVSTYIQYAPAKINVMPLTEFVYPAVAETKINVYVTLSDSFGCQIKAPAVFRFELYEYVQRSAEPKGRRIVIWPDIDLTNASDNNRYWQDFLRAYKFNLDFTEDINRSYILQVTCLCTSGKRLSAEFGFGPVE